MSRNQNKIYNAQPNPHSQRRFISPNQLRTSETKPQKIEQYRSAEREPAKGKDQPSASGRPDKSKDKNKSQLSSETPSRSTTQKGTGTGNQDRSRSKERKDYMTANLARLTRKKEEKLSSSNVSEQSNPSQKQSHPPARQTKQRYIYTFKEEIKQKNQQVLQEYAPMPSSIQRVDPSSGSQLSPILPSSVASGSQRGNEGQRGSEMQGSSNNTSVAISSKGKQIEVNLVRFEDRNGLKNEIKEGGFRESANTIRQEPQQAVKTPAETVPPPQQTQGLSFKRIPPEPAPTVLPKEQPPFLPPQSPRQDLSLRIRRLQSDKHSLQQSNARLLQQKFQLQGETAFLGGKCQELQRQLSALRETVGRNVREAERTGSANQRMFLQLEERYNALLQEYRSKAKQASEMATERAALDRRTEQLSNALRSAQEESRIHVMQLDKAKRLYQARILQVRQQHEFQLKQMELRSAGQTRQDSRLQQGMRQVQRELAAKNKELELRGRQVEELEFQLRDRDDLEGLLHVKQTENAQLIAELDKTKEILHRANAEAGETLQRLAIELKEKERQIHTLTEAAAQAKSRNQMQKLSLNAHTDLFGGGNGDNGEGTSSFTDLIRSQSEETNKLRSTLADREETIFHLTAEGEELRERVRRLEQDLQLNARTYTVNLANANQVREATELMLKKRIAALESLRAAH